MIGASILGDELPHFQADKLERIFDKEKIETALLRDVRNWNTGMGAYEENWDGLFRTSLDRRFRQLDPSSPQTVVSQSRGIYLNAEGYKIAKGDDRVRIGTVMDKAIRRLRSHGWDPVYGGFYFELENDGALPPDLDDKNAFAQVQAIFALCHAYGSTGRAEYLDFAWDATIQFERHHRDARVPGAYLPHKTRNYSSFVENGDIGLPGVNNIEYMLHYFEAMLAMYDVTIGARHEFAKERIREIGAFMAERMVHPAGPGLSYTPFWYGADWGPHLKTYDPAHRWEPSRYAMPGHNVELAWLFSRAVERGFDEEWLRVGRELIAFALAHAVDGEAGGIRYERVDESGNPIDVGEEARRLVWWPQAELARALAHWSMLRSSDYWRELRSAVGAIESVFEDPLHGGWYESFVVDSESPIVEGRWNGFRPTERKGSFWKINYHETMYYAEILRLLEMKDPQAASRHAFAFFEREADPEGTSPSGDFDRDGMSNHQEYLIGTDPRSVLDAKLARFNAFERE